MTKYKPTGIEEIVKKHNTARYFKLDKNYGPAVGRIFAVQKSLGDLLLFLDDDAYLIDNSTLDKTINFYQKNNYGQLGLQSLEIFSQNSYFTMYNR